MHFLGGRKSHPVQKGSPEVDTKSGVECSLNKSTRVVVNHREQTSERFLMNWSDTARRPLQISGQWNLCQRIGLLQCCTKDKTAGGGTRIKGRARLGIKAKIRLKNLPPPALSSNVFPEFAVLGNEVIG